jgi:hypothetical protein
VRPLARLAAIYQLVERTHRSALEQTHAALQEVEATVAQQGAVEHAARLLAHTARTAAERHEGLLCESQRELALWNLAALAPVREQRCALRDAAEVDYRNSLRDRHQIDALIERTQIAAVRQQTRREQAVADDRFLARTRWLSRVKRS